MRQTLLTLCGHALVVIAVGGFACSVLFAAIASIGTSEPARLWLLATVITVWFLPLMGGFRLLTLADRLDHEDDARCPHCGYDLRGHAVPARCPECGELADHTRLDDDADR